MATFRVYFVDGNWIDVECDGLKAGDDGFRAESDDKHGIKEVHLTFTQVRAIVNHEHLETSKSSSKTIISRPTTK